MDCERVGMVNGGNFGLASGRWKASTALELPMESEDALVGADVAGDWDEVAGENATTLSLSRSLLLDGDERAQLFADVRS